MKTSVTMKFEKAELKSRQESEAFAYAGRYDGYNAFAKREVTGALKAFNFSTLQEGLEQYHSLLTQGYTQSAVFSEFIAGSLTFTLVKPENAQEIELKEEYKFVEAEYREEIDAYNEAFIEAEVQKHLATEQRKREAEQAQAAVAHRGAVAAEVRAALGVR